MDQTPINVLMLNCTLKKSPADSNTQALLGRVAERFKEHGAATEIVRVVDHDVPPGVMPDSQGEGDEFPAIYEKIKACDALVVASPVWLGHIGSVLQRVLERLDGSMSQTDEKGQMPFMGKVAGCVVTGNEDGAHAVCEGALFNLTHMGFTVPPLADCYWVGPAGPGKSYAAAGGEKHLYTNKTARYLAATLSWHARLLKANPLPIDYTELTKRAKEESDSEGQQFFGD